ncbi:carboxypeptidase M32 [Granulosicoccus antarcticus]|uniref:Metal-dependent carboxypeptidase n=1 Tax=Granulosicoccus antarcticus IMCC3135 TaxID=1192854 RepID=A0A2Z2NUE3_9GAMM|nr:carboxypeptidase M32 [Granulosicoccus antarcticus]ASJ74863.1 Thermostable carboxypeptidase 1 [Granulosicoccus antarcticus IMCC3135]
MSQSIKQLENRFHRLAQLDHASTFLSWDQMVMMPNAGNEPRSAALAELASLRHELLTAPEVGDWIGEAELALATDSSTTESDATTATAHATANATAHIREMKRSWHQAMALPAELVHAKVIAGSRCEHGWRTQRGNNDWAGFLENFRPVVALAREEAQCRQALAPERFATPYDALLDLHCTGDSQALISGVFAQLKQELPGLMQEVMERQASQSITSLEGSYPIAQQQALSESLMSMLGFDFESGRLDVSMHPFSTGVKGDQRITTRYRETDFADALQATAHETGHAAYESGLPDELQSFPVGRARNMCIHESQSLLFEKHLFLSRSFGKAMLEPLHRHLPATVAFDSDAIWMAQTRVKPSFIRVEADEVSYPLHVMLRYDIESALINGKMEADDIPEAWQASLQNYLGLSVSGNHALGCLQDIHWTDGAFGYFPSYTMGAVNAAQLGASFKQQHPEWQQQFAQGDVGFVRQWLSDNIWKHGCALESQQLMSAATGEGSDARHLLAHLRSRYLQDID